MKWTRICSVLAIPILLLGLGLLAPNATSQTEGVTCQGPDPASGLKLMRYSLFDDGVTRLLQMEIEDRQSGETSNVTVSVDSPIFDSVYASVLRVMNEPDNWDVGFSVVDPTITLCSFTIQPRLAPTPTPTITPTPSIP